jgi:proline dehydrogenase
MTVQMPAKDKTESEPKVESAPSTGSSGPSIIDTIPLQVVLLLAAPYLAGKTKEDALKKAHQVYKESRFASTIDILGEDCTSDADCDAFVTAYDQVLRLVAGNQIPCHRTEERITVSFKPSMFSTVIPTEAEQSDARLVKAYHRIRSVVDLAKQLGVNMTLEAEDHRWADFHLNTYFALLDEGYTNLGTVLQSRLFRTKEDLKRFDERCRVRMVIGIYNEPASIAYTEKPRMKELLVEYAAELAARGTYLEIASHDTDCVTNFLTKVAIPQRLAANKFEFQMLLGVPRKEFQQSLVSGSYFKEVAQNADSNALEYLSDLARSGLIMRMYLPFGKDRVAGPYCKRRLKANPNMISYGIKNFLHIK